MAGLPEIDDLDTVGGEKEDYEPVEDPVTDLAAAHWNLVAMNATMVTQTATRAIRRFVGHATTPAEPSSNPQFAVWGNGVSVLPTVAKGGTGIYDITWPTSVTDPLGVSHTVNFVDGTWNVNGSTAYTCTLTVTSPNVVRLRVFDMAGVANDGAGATFAVFVR